MEDEKLISWLEDEMKVIEGGYRMKNADPIALGLVTCLKHEWKIDEEMMTFHSKFYEDVKLERFKCSRCGIENRFEVHQD